MCSSDLPHLLTICQTLAAAVFTNIGKGEVWLVSLFHPCALTHGWRYNVFVERQDFAGQEMKLATTHSKQPITANQDMNRTQGWVGRATPGMGASRHSTSGVGERRGFLSVTMSQSRRCGLSVHGRCGPR